MTKKGDSIVWIPVVNKEIGFQLSSPPIQVKKSPSSFVCTHMSIRIYSAMIVVAGAGASASFRFRRSRGSYLYRSKMAIYEVIRPQPRGTTRPLYSADVAPTADNRNSCKLICFIALYYRTLKWWRVYFDDWCLGYQGHYLRCLFCFWG